MVFSGVSNAFKNRPTPALRRYLSCAGCLRSPAPISETATRRNRENAANQGAARYSRRVSESHFLRIGMPPSPTYFFALEPFSDRYEPTFNAYEAGNVTCRCYTTPTAAELPLARSWLRLFWKTFRRGFQRLQLRKIAEFLVCPSIGSSSAVCLIR